MSKNKNMNMGLTRRRRLNPATTPNGTRPRVKIDFDGQTLNGLQFSPAIVTITNQAASVHLMDCSNTNATGIGLNIYNQSVAQTLSGITGVYSEYIYRSVTFTWMPYVSPGVSDGGAQIYISYQDNPEMIASATISSASAIFTSAKASRNMKSFNAWERFTFTVPVSNRRRTFDCNTTTTIGSTDTYDRSVQGAVIVGYNSPTAAVSLGQWKINYHLELRKLNYANTT